MRNEWKGKYIKEGLKAYKGGSVRLLRGSCVAVAFVSINVVLERKTRSEKERKRERNEAVRAGKTVTRRSYSSCVAA
jgi:hypothetical protein